MNRMKKGLKTLLGCVSLVLSSCANTATPINSKDLVSPIQGFYRVKNLKLGEEKIPNSKNNIFRVLKLSETEADFMMIYFQNGTPSAASGTDVLKLNGRTIEAYFKNKQVASFRLRKRVKVSYHQGNVYQFDAKRFNKKKNKKWLNETYSF